MTELQILDTIQGIGGKMMLYEELLMDGPTLLKFKLFKHLKKIETINYPIAKVSESIDLNYQQTVIDLTEIEQDLKELREDQKDFMIGAGKLDCTKILTTTDEYRYFLLNESVPFQFILYFLNEQNPTIDKFCEKYYVSRSTVSRKIANLKKHLKKFRLRFTYTEASLAGDERLVRIALFNTLWLGTRGLYWPLDVSEKQAELLSNEFGNYFPQRNTYVGRLEMKLFAGITLARMKKGKFVKYDHAYDFLLQKNKYYNYFYSLEVSDILFTELDISKRQAKAENSFVYFLARYSPAYTQENDQALHQTIQDFSTRLNPVYSLTKEFLGDVKHGLQTEHYETLDSPLILGNLLNVTFAFYVFRQAFPNIQNLVLNPNSSDTTDQNLEERITKFFEKIKDNPKYDFINDETRPLLVRMYTNILSPYFNGLEYSKHLKVGMVFEHNYLLVRKLYQFIGDLHFAEVEPFKKSSADSYDLVISSSLLLKENYPELPVYLWDHTYEDSEMIRLYQKLRQVFVQKNS